jgi:hypothetical protein
VIAVTCLLLAAGTALSPAARPRPARVGPSTSSRRPGVGGSLAAGQVAVPVTVSAAGSSRYLRAGDHIGLLAGSSEDGPSAPTASLLGDGLRVLAVSHPPPDEAGDPSAGGVVIVAATRAVAARIAAVGDRQLLAVIDPSP